MGLESSFLTGQETGKGVRKEGTVCAAGEVSVGCKGFWEVGVRLGHRVERGASSPCLPHLGQEPLLLWDP